MGTTREAAEGNRNRRAPDHPKETIDRIRRLWNGGGHDARQIGVIVGMTRGAVIAVANRHPEFVRKGKGPVDPDYIAQVKAMWLDWMSGPMIANRLGRDKRAIYAMAKRYGWPKKSELYRRG